MHRPARQFRAQLSELEGRWLLSTAPALTHAPPPYWQTGVSFEESSQIATQQDGAAIVNVHRYVIRYPSADTTQPMPLQQVRVTTDPSPAVGVNVAPVDQILTFATGQTDALLSVPILAGAPNPGEVDVTLTLTPIDPPPQSPTTSLSTSGPLELKIRASEAQIPPTIVYSKYTPQGVALTFSKPMDPAGASNVNNYRFDVYMGIFVNPRPVKMKAAQYDPSTYTVSLVLAGKHQSNLSVYGGRNRRRNAGPPLADVDGNLINGDTTPGQFFLNAMQIGQSNPNATF